ncbi:hypothetical protein [Methanomethylovorans hollandica]|uniref:hypothetical protein n=1 Tax=Methanomethylovorans hollandica TaxID=101192 RepID=UPI0012EA818F|nr:hypothetical protein [Methanomethylovorans hollandica]
MHQKHDHLLLLIVRNAVAKNPANTASASHAFGSHFVSLIQYVPSANRVTDRCLRCVSDSRAIHSIG